MICRHFARIALPAAALGLAFLPAQASAQEDEIEAVAETLGDPDVQQAVAGTLAVITEILMEMPVGPMLEAAAEATGKDAKDIDPDTRLRDIAGDRGARVSEDVERLTPRAMEISEKRMLPTPTTVSLNCPITTSSRPTA